MKTIICGGRDYYLTDSDHARLSTLPITEVVSCGARGADHGGEVWAYNNDVPLKKFPADWDTHGKSAGFIRNEQMAEYAEACVAFPGGNGTADMVARAKKHGLTIYDFR